MFPKAHAAAYVMMAWRIAYCKGILSSCLLCGIFLDPRDGFNYEIMCQGKERLEYFYKDYTRRKDSLSKRSRIIYRDMKIVQEMYARGFDFTPIDVYRAKPDRFQVIDGKLMPALNTIDGMGDNAAIAVAEGGKGRQVLSKDDFRQRTKATKTVIDLMADLGLLGELPSQISCRCLILHKSRKEAVIFGITAFKITVGREKITSESAGLKQMLVLFLSSSYFAGF